MVGRRLTCPVAPTARFTAATLSCAISLLVASCEVANPQQPTAPAELGGTPSAIESEPTPTDIWLGLQQRTPVPASSPLPPAERTPIDGTYAKFDESWPQWWMCRRCADYRPAGGIWRLRFDRGVMRIYYNVTGWVSLASYRVSGDRLYLFNDPYCPEATGEYRWSLEDRWGLVDRFLTLAVIADPCSFGLRGENLGTQAWGACFPPSEMTAASDHWHKPLGCEDANPALLGASAAQNPSVQLSVHQGDAREFTVPPDVHVDANVEGAGGQGAVEVRSDPASIPYGLNRVLWGEGNGVEAATDLSFEAIGVQVLGDNTIGWARVLLDGQEVWRGNTLEIWTEKGRFGGYIEVSGLAPGPHTLRIESLGLDFRPVTVAFFGFSEVGGVRR